MTEPADKQDRPRPKPGPGDPASTSEKPPPQALQGWALAAALLALVSAALVAVLVVGFISWHHQREVSDHFRDLNAARASATKAATDFAVDFGSYDYRDLDSDFRGVAKRMTTSFSKSYLETSTRLKPTFVQYKTQVTAQVQSYGVRSISAGKAVVVVFLDQRVRTTQSATTRIDRNRLEIHLVKRKGAWLVDKLLAK